MRVSSTFADISWLSPPFFQIRDRRHTYAEHDRETRLGQAEPTACGQNVQGLGSDIAFNGRNPMANGKFIIQTSHDGFYGLPRNQEPPNAFAFAST